MTFDFPRLSTFPARRPGRPARRGGRVLGLIAAVLLMVLPAVPAGAEKDGDNGIDYTKPFIYDALPPSEMPREESGPDVADVRKRLAGKNLTARQRGRLLSEAARLEMQRGNRRQAERDIEAAFETGALSDADKAENYHLLARLHAGKKPPDFEKAIEYQRKSNEIGGKRTRKRR